MKAYTDVNQSKKLAKILPLETADCYWDYDEMQKFHRINWFEDGYNKENQLRLNENNVCAWSLAALLDVLPDYIRHYDNGTYKIYNLNLYKAYYCNVSYTFGPSTNENDDTLYCFGRDNFVDACVELIDKLHKQKLL